MSSGIYKITNTINEKCYIGSAVDLHRRKAQHWSVLHRGKHHSKYLQNAFNKYGANAFTFEVLEYVDDPQVLLPAEQHYLDLLQPEYNILQVAGSVLGLKHSEETLAKLRGRKISKAARENMAAAKRGVKQSLERVARRAVARSKPVQQYTRDGEFVAEYPSAAEAMRQTGISDITIAKCAKGERKSAGKFIWRFAKK